MGNSSTQSLLYNIYCSYSPYLLCISELWICVSSNPASYLRQCRTLSLVATNDKGDAMPTMWLFRRDRRFACIVVSISSQKISIDILGFLVTFVYASTCVASRRNLWNDLLGLND